MKTCITCQQEKPIEDFYIGRNECKVCKVAKQIAYQRTEAGKATQRKSHWMYRYGISEEKYNEMLEAQGGVCAICKTDKPGPRQEFFNIDHDHACCPGKRSCGKCVRGLLCLRCNSNVGWLETNEAGVTGYLGRYF